MAKYNATHLADTERNDVNYRNKFHANRYCSKCRQETKHLITHVAIHSSKCCTLCGEYDWDDD